MTMADHLAWFLGWLGRASLQASVLIVLILAARLLLRDHLAPRWRHALWLLLVLRLLLPWSPPSRMSVFNLFEGFPGRAEKVAAAAETARESMAAIMAPMAIAPGPQDSEAFVVEMAEPEQDMAYVAPAMILPEEPAPPHSEAAAPAVAARSWGWLAWVAMMFAWLTGCLTVMGVAVAQSLALGSAIRTQRPVTDQRTLELLESCKAALGVRAWLAVVEAQGLASPALLGFVRPRLLLPQGAMGELGPDRLRHIFLHELAHLKRRDILMNWVLTALQAVHWFNPLVWLAFRRMREDRELACDALVLSRLGPGEASEYGRTILALLERFAEPRRLAGLAGILEDKKQIKRRLTMIARFKRPSSLWSAVAALLMLGLGGAALTSAQPDHRTAQTAAHEDVTIIKHQEAAPGGGAPDHAAPGARLRIQDFRIEPYSEGGLFSPSISLKNVGDAPSPKYRVKFYRNKAERESPSHNNAGPIEPGGEWREGMMPIALKEGENRITVEVSPDGAASEAERVRHVAEMTVTIKGGAIVSKRVEIKDAVIMKKAVKHDASTAGSDETKLSAPQTEAKDEDVNVETFADSDGKRVIITRRRSTGDARMGLGNLATSLPMQFHLDKLQAKLEPAMQEGLKRAAEAQQAIIEQAKKMMELAQRITDESTRQAMLEQARQMQATAQKQLDAFREQMARLQTEGQAELQKNLAILRKRMDEQRSRMGEAQEKIKQSREELGAQMQKAMAELERVQAEMEAKASGVKGGAAGPNPVIRDLRIEPAAAPGEYRLIIRIVNEGSEAAEPFKVYLVRDADAWRAQGGKVESIKDYWGQVGPMKPGEERVLEPYPTAIQDGERRIAVLIGPEGKTDAEAASKNRAELTVKVEGGKIVSRSLTIERTSNDPKSAGEGKAFSYERRIESGSREKREPLTPGDAPAIKERTEREIRP